MKIKKDQKLFGEKHSKTMNTEKRLAQRSVATGGPKPKKAYSPSRENAPAGGKRG